MSETKKEPVDYLQADSIQIPGQKYALISVVSPSSNQKNDTCGVKIRGVFESVDEAQMHTKKLNMVDSLFDVYLVELYKWLPIPPNTDMIENQEYQDGLLNQIVKGHAEEQLKAKEFFEQRKLELMEGKGDPLDGLGIEYPAVHPRERAGGSALETVDESDQEQTNNSETQEPSETIDNSTFDESN